MHKGYSEGFQDGVASVRKSPLIVIDWSTLTGGIVNTIGFVALMTLAFWLGELRGYKETGRLSITFSDVAEKTDKAELPGKMQIRVKE